MMAFSEHQIKDLLRWTAGGLNILHWLLRWLQTTFPLRTALPASLLYFGRNMVNIALASFTSSNEVSRACFRSQCYESVLWCISRQTTSNGLILLSVQLKYEAFTDCILLIWTGYRQLKFPQVVTDAWTSKEVLNLDVQLVLAPQEMTPQVFLGGTVSEMFPSWNSAHCFLHTKQPHILFEMPV